MRSLICDLLWLFLFQNEPQQISFSLSEFIGLHVGSQFALGFLPNFRNTDGRNEICLTSYSVKSALVTIESNYGNYEVNLEPKQVGAIYTQRYIGIYLSIVNHHKHKA